MSMLEGVSQCWWLSERCVVDWEAWSAIGTFLAVYVALRIALSEQIRNREAAVQRALGLSALLVPDIERWRQNIRQLVHHVEKERAQAIMESFDPDGGDILRVPDSVRENLHRIHDLNEPARDLSVAVACANAARAMRSKVESALRPDANDRQEVLNLFRDHLGSAGAALTKASNEMNRLIFQAPKKRSRWRRLLFG
jgi:hypothetical protein